MRASLGLMPRLWLLGLTLLVACAGPPYHAPDSGCRIGCVDAETRDAGTFADAFTARLELTDPLGECLPEDEAECGCIDGFRRCDTCGWCPTGFGCDENAGVCRGRDLDARGPGTGTWDDTCSLTVPNRGELSTDPHLVLHGYCATGKVCGTGARWIGPTFDTFTGLCYPVSFCQVAALADPPVENLHCIYSDGTDVVEGPPDIGACPAGDRREPYCGGVCGDNLRCPLYPSYDSFQGRFNPPEFSSPSMCIAFSETRSFGVCAYGTSGCLRGDMEGNEYKIQQCEMGYGEPCGCLGTHEPADAPPPLRAYVVLASVCRDYVLHFPGSTECVDAAWNPLPPP